MEFTSNVCSILTPPGRGAVAVIAVAGPTAESTVDSLFISVSNSHLSAKQQQTIFYGHWRSTGEDVVIVKTGQNRIEIQCHGGQTAPAAIVSSLEKHGFTQIERGDAALSLYGGRWRSEIAMEMSNAITEKTASLLLHQYTIADQQLANLKKQLETDPQSLLGELEHMIGWTKFGRRLLQPSSVVFCGRPNVGKSSLVNAIVGFNRTIVHKTAGTTRDVVAQITAVEGWPIELKDTAGLRNSSNEIEKIGIGFAENEIRSADLVVNVVDATETSKDLNWLAKLQAPLVVVNKSDLVEKPDLRSQHPANPFPKSAPIFTSAVTGQGIGDLLCAIANRLVPQLPPRDLLIPVTDNQAETLRQLRAWVRAEELERAVGLLDHVAE